MELNFREEIMWRQRSQIQWLAEGDGNTKFFHQKATTRKRRNKISQLVREDGTIYSDEEEINGMAKDFYKHLYDSKGTIGMEEVLSHIPRKVDEVMNDMLYASYKESEVKEALFQMYPTKVPGQMAFLPIFSEKLGCVWR